MTNFKYHNNTQYQGEGGQLKIPDTCSMSIPKAAVAWRQAGWQPVPLNRDTGVPLVKWRIAPSLSPFKTFELFRSFQGCRLAIALPSGVVVLDIDHRPAKGWMVSEILLALNQRFNLPRVPLCTTPSGGAHLWFSVPDGCRPKNWTSQAGRFPIEGVDVRCLGGLITVPPTQRSDGAYKWADWMPDLPEAPSLLVEALTPPRQKPIKLGKAKAYSPKRLTRYVETIYKREIEAVRLSGRGGRNAQLFKSSAALGSIVAAGGLPLDHVRESLLAAALACGLTNEDGATASHQTIESGLRAGLAKPRRLPEGGQ